MLVETDDQGRYVAEGFHKVSYRAPNARTAATNRIVVQANDPGKGSLEVVTMSDGRDGVIAFAANTPQRVNFSVSSAADIAYVGGAVLHSSTGDGVEGVEIRVDYGTGAATTTPLNATYVSVATASGTTSQVRKLLTDANGAYTANIHATGDNVMISAKKEFMFFHARRAHGHGLGRVEGRGNHLRRLRFRRDPRQGG